VHVPRKNRESWREDADDSLLAARDRHGLADDIRTAPENPCPQISVNPPRRFSSPWRIPRKEETAAKRLDSHHGEKIPSAAARAHAFRTADPAEGGRIASKPRTLNLLERAAVLYPSLIRSPGGTPILSILDPHFRYQHKLFRIFQRERPQYERIHQAEDCGVRADAERQGEDGHQRESRVLAEHPRAEAQVLPE